MSVPMHMDGKVAVITGSTKGIGREMALLFAESGCRIVVNGSNAQRAEETAALVKERGSEAAVCLGDVSRQETADALMECAFDRFGRLDVLVSNAGIVTLEPFLEFRSETWQRFLDVHLSGTFLCGQAAARRMRDAGAGGRIVNIATIAATMGMYGFAAYAAAKGGVIALTKVMAVELAQYGITVNCIAPGPVANEQLLNLYGAEYLKERGKTIPLNRLADAREVAQVALFLASPEAAYVTGQIIAVDGGASAAGCYAHEVYKRAQAAQNPGNDVS